MLVDHVLSGFGGRTAAQAIDEGVDPREVWRALCADFDVPARPVVSCAQARLLAALTMSRLA